MNIVGRRRREALAEAVEQSTAAMARMTDAQVAQANAACAILDDSSISDHEAAEFLGCGEIIVGALRGGKTHAKLKIAARSGEAGRASDAIRTLRAIEMSNALGEYATLERVVAQLTVEGVLNPSVQDAVALLDLMKLQQ